MELLEGAAQGTTKHYRHERVKKADSADDISIIAPEGAISEVIVETDAGGASSSGSRAPWVPLNVFDHAIELTSVD